MSNFKTQFRRENYFDDNCQNVPPQCRALPLAISTVPMQVWENIICDPAKALHCGTIFADLYLPFIGTGGCRR